jgi:hypothetical protein
MTRAQSDSLLLFILGCAFFVSVGVASQRISLFSQIDFKGLYYGSRCLLEGGDPYRQSDLLRVYQAGAADHPGDIAGVQQIVVTYVNLPSTLIFAVPFAMLPWGPAHLAWMTMTAACFILAAYLMWRVGTSAAPLISGALIFLLLCGSELLIEVGNAAGIAVALCVIAAWCFLEKRFVWAGTVGFALSLLLKPHVTGPILIYFLLTKGESRKHALRTIAVTFVLGLAAVLWIYHVAPDWRSGLQANLHEINLRGGINDPGPTRVDPRGHGAQIISLQTALSLVKNDPRFYNPATYIACAPLLIIWAVTTMRRRFTKGNAWFAIATIAVLSMLPLYHRQHDSRLLLFLVPAMAIFWAGGGSLARIAFWLTAACAFLTGDLTCQFLAIAADRMHMPAHGPIGQLINLGMTRPAPLILSVVGVFYLWVYVRHGRQFQTASPVNQS